MIANPIAASAAAIDRISIVNTCPNISPENIENDIKLIFTANKINSIDIKITITFFLFKNIPTIPKEKILNYNEVDSYESQTLLSQYLKPSELVCDYKTAVVANNRLYVGNIRQDGKILPDALLIPQGSTAKDLAYAVHTDLGDGFIRATDARSGRVIGADHELANDDVVKIHAKT